MKKKTLKAFNKLEIQREEFLNLFHSHSENQLQFRQEANSWNMLQVMRHLVTAESMSLTYIKRKVNNADKLQKADFMAKLRALLLKIALALPIKFKAPKIAEVKEENPDFESTVEEWNNVREELHELLENTDEAIFSKTIYKHPRAGYLTLKQTLEFMEDHINHHRKQIGRIMNHPQFPDE
ncbi:DinB family protein [Rhodohalobacter sp.]|uniref:DinB family protein n=1 Tax=Rhodohalobacter sp. TaxID=1974210 RepID=UPI002ACE1059|nr:DinB family protein [Rhodohalobacter sp.]MDZ7757984.1 DinB family protein [Rhodohalobacter sp.]